MTKNKRKITEQEALDRLMWICSRTEKCKSDMRKKLKEWELDVSLWDKLIRKLEKEKFLDEERFTTYFVRDKIRYNKWGRNKVRYQLKMKQIPDEIITTAVEAFDQDEYYEMLKSSVLEKKRKTKGKNDWEIKSKVLRFGQSRGYEYDLMMDVLDLPEE